MKTRIIVDSTADFGAEFKNRVHTVPLTVNFGSEEFIDGVTIDQKTFYEKLIESDVLPTTSQATPEAFIQEFEKAKQAGEAAVVITGWTLIIGSVCITMTGTGWVTRSRTSGTLQFQVLCFVTSFLLLLGSTRRR